jgi:Calcium-dependent channel, 7TM region, putative phosphate
MCHWLPNHEYVAILPVVDESGCICLLTAFLFFVLQEIIWENAHVPKSVLLRRERFANFVLALGVVLWAFPLAAIQAIAKAENLSQIPGMEWIFQINGGYFTTLVNGYLPVVALLGLILILPVIFEYIAVRYERRKTLSDVQASMLGRYFYYQLANIYVTVTAGSVLRSLAEMIESPSSILPLLGKSIPLMVGYFVALLVTKTLAGLPMVFLRFGALMRMLLLLILSDDKKLTQRELDAIYRLENVQYGWEFPTQLLTVVIVFSYAVICPIILPFGLLYFMGALMVYKKQVLYVYSPVYESGGAMFPLAVQRSLFGLVCAQMTFWGYVVFRGCYYQPVFLFPLPILTVLGMNHLYKTYAVPSEKLSLERARECDRRSSIEQRRKAFREEGADSKNADFKSPNDARQESSSRTLLNHGIAARRNKFDKNMYRQPVLTEVAAEPWPYRRGQAEDSETATVKYQLQQINRYIVSMTDSERKKHVDLLSPP